MEYVGEGATRGETTNGAMVSTEVEGNVFRELPSEVRRDGFLDRGSTGVSARLLLHIDDVSLEGWLAGRRLAGRRRALRLGAAVDEGLAPWSH